MIPVNKSSLVVICALVNVGRSAFQDTLFHPVSYSYSSSVIRNTQTNRHAMLLETIYADYLTFGTQLTQMSVRVGDLVDPSTLFVYA